MRPTIASAARVGSVIGEAASSRSFVCRDCVARGSAIGAPQGQRRSYAGKPDKSSKAKRSFLDTEKWRRKIWGTDSPPGLKDPYSGSQIAPELNQKESQELDTGIEQTGQEVREFEGATIEDAKAYDPDYEPATSWDGLPKIGGPTGWWEKVWDEDNKFQSFANPRKELKKTWTPNLASNYIHRAYVETRVLQEAGLDLNDVKYIPIETDIKHRFIKVVPGAAGSVSLEFPTDTWRQEIIDAVRSSEELVEDEYVEDEIDAVAAPGTAADAVTPTRAEAEAVVEDLAEPAAEKPKAQKPAAEIPLDKKGVPKDWGRSSMWRNIRLDDQAFKFALIKRVIQLTGHKIPDLAIAVSDHLGGLMVLGFKYQAPKKLANRLLEKPQNFQEPNRQWKKPANVTVHKKRQTYVHAEKQVGRWKEIQKELKKRGLPLPRRSSSAQY